MTDPTPAAPTTQEAKRALELFAPHSPLQPITITGLTLRGIFARIEAEARDTARREAEPHQDYAGRTCTTGLLHHHAAPPQPSAPQALDVERLERTADNLSLFPVHRSVNGMPFWDAFVVEYARLSRLPSEEER